MRYSGFGLVLAVGAAWWMGAGCAEGGTVGEAYQNLGGNKGSGGAGGEGASSSSSTSSSSTSSTTTSSSSSSTTTSSSSSGTGGTPSCGQGGQDSEPNDVELQANLLPNITDSDGDGKSLSGILDGPEDQDWFKYTGDDVSFSVVDPTRENLVMQPSGRLCKFVQCFPSGDTPTITCPGGTSTESSPDGRPGCCGTMGFTVDIECPGSDDDATVFFRFDNPAAEACVTYSMDYHF